ncbi:MULTISPECIES: DUF4440 domain-containing protein [Thermoactinomyces]|jgi:hypothetical protein|uniref:DUF4440 domain-containing protein n=1 Tax=Thermoactinomyces daqus TaxID=1329516 RepID=A0A7W1X7Y5_9BACL|nr:MULTISPECIES: DUF4440 domain-containing protein [Thermoactinomyces]MBA4541644.1 DUF4440 domain-containing protein [Thermoactinomyces daqus]MBH8597641.1 DUF4440 domain-containing protein [Thermoactinomyces sp. CICC 10523]MBH8603982.1 DUF4440 domain-containing protein [Thermoactinomyces sp. CICC 10522]MBH8606484.1 DUF4440 domain-containing protein [Thermoactinomyces sp. CICC 10521]
MESGTSLKEHLRQLEEKLLLPEVRRSREELSKLLADEFFEFGSSGTVWSKEEIGSEGLSVRKMSLSHFEVHLLAPDVALTTYRVKDETRKMDTLRSSVWKLKEGRWQMIFHQGTPTSPMSDEP